MIYIYGNGNQAREIKGLLESGYFNEFKKQKSFYTIRQELMKIHETDTVPSNKLSARESIIMSVGSPYYKRKEVDLNPNLMFSKITSSSAILSPSSSIGVGSIIMPGCIISTNVNIGNYCLLNLACTISHDVSIGDYATISPGTSIAGGCDIKDGVFIGIGSTISNGIKVAKGVTIGAGSLVMDDLLEENGVYFGSPAKLVKKNNEWLKIV